MRGRSRTWTAVALVILPLAMSDCLLQERNGGDAASVHNASADHIWLAYDLGERRAVLLELDPDETGPVCFRDATDLYVYDTDPTAESQPAPLAVMDFEGEDLCEGTYRWNGSALNPLG